MTRRRWPAASLLLLTALTACSQLSPSTTVEPVPAPSPSVATAPAAQPQGSGDARSRHPLLLITNHAGDSVSLVDPNTGDIITIPAVSSPWGVVVSPDGRTAYVSGAQAVAVIDLERKARSAVIPYSRAVSRVDRGEHREGGMGIDISPDGRRVFVGLHVRSGPGVLEVLDTASNSIVSVHALGIRPFQVIAAADSRTAYSLDHDSYSVTVVDTQGTVRALAAAPLGRGAYDKPHYGALSHDGRLLLPYQGRTLQTLDPMSGQSSERPLKANTHQHGVALTADGRRLLIVGTGPAGGVNGPPSLTIVDLLSDGERIVPLTREHEMIAVSPDGRWAYLTGGYLLGNGWDGITIVGLENGTTREIPVPGQPLGIAVVPSSDSGG